MKAALLALSAFALASTAAAEQPRPVQAWLKDARERITQAAAADPRVTEPVTVQFRLSADQRLTGVHAVRTSGSAVVDQAVVDATRKTRLAKAPFELVGREITVLENPTPPAVQTAATGSPAR